MKYFRFSNFEKKTVCESFDCKLIFEKDNNKLILKVEILHFRIKISMNQSPISTSIISSNINTMKTTTICTKKNEKNGQRCTKKQLNRKKKRI